MMTKKPTPLMGCWTYRVVFRPTKPLFELAIGLCKTTFFNGGNICKDNALGSCGFDHCGDGGEIGSNRIVPCCSCGGSLGYNGNYGWSIGENGAKDVIDNGVEGTIDNGTDGRSMGDGETKDWRAGGCQGNGWGVHSGSIPHSCNS
ncbi:hypothetical protein Droror1_Dr00006221 [Drosera rotundifolia]